MWNKALYAAQQMLKTLISKEVLFYRTTNHLSSARSPFFSVTAHK
jgi:hypothetical protein